tara:strand:- start:2302 stop:2697 length:396 start_codon:yes stop_codon:yes gene_type:complete
VIIQINQLFKNDRTILAMVFFSITVVLFAWAGILYSSPKLDPDTNQKIKADMKYCKEFIKTKGFDVKPKSSISLEASSSKFDDPKFRFTAVEGVFLACNNLELTGFCMGVASDCGINGMKFSLNYKLPKQI